MQNNVSQTALESLRNYLDTLYPIPDDEFEKLAMVLHFKKFNKGEVVLQEGKVCRHFWFLLKGCFRIFSLENGLEVNVRFFFEQTIAADFISLRHQIPSHFYIVAIEDSEVLYSYKPDYRPIINFSNSLIMWTAEFFAHNFYDEMEHSNSFKLMSPEERYKSLLLKNPKYFQRIPLTYLASYLGMSRKTLTRIRSNIHQ